MGAKADDTAEAKLGVSTTRGTAEPEAAHVQPSASSETEAEQHANEASQRDTEPKPPLTGLDSEHTSAESLVRAVLKALKERDEAALTRLRVNYREYTELLFPHFEAAKPPHTIPADFHWKLLNTKSIVGAREALQNYGGQEFELLEVIPRNVETFPTFKALRKVRVKLRRVSDGAVDTVTIFGSIIEMDSKYKLLSFPS